METRKKGQLSVVVPVYNVSNYICECVDSILNQTYRNLEVILVDDGSTDDSLEKCKYYMEKDSRVKVIHQENSGVSVARNIGIENATGEFITFLDSDDYYSSDFVYEQMISKMQYENVDIAVYGFIRFEDGKFISKKAEIESKILSQLECYELLHEKSQRIFLPLVFPGAKIYRMELFDYSDVRFVKNRYAEDLLFAHFVLKYVRNVFWYNENFYVWRIVGNSRSHAKYSTRFLDLFRNYIDILETLTDYSSETFFQQCIEECLDSGVRHFCKACRLGLLSKEEADVYQTDLVNGIDKYLPLYRISKAKRVKWLLYRRYPRIYLIFVKAKAKISGK